jgi:PAS domain S-box-containing protein
VASTRRLSGENISIAGRDGKFLYVSPAVERLLGLPVDCVPGRSAHEIRHAEDAQRRGDGLPAPFRTPGAEPVHQGRYHRAGARRRISKAATP